MVNEFEKRDQFEDGLVRQIAQRSPELVEEKASLSEMYMPTYQIKVLNAITSGSKSLNKLSVKAEQAVNALADELQGGVSSENFRRVNKLLNRATEAQQDLGEQVNNLKNSLKALKRDISKAG